MGWGLSWSLPILGWSAQPADRHEVPPIRGVETGHSAISLARSLAGPPGAGGWGTQAQWKGPVDEGTCKKFSFQNPLKECFFCNEVFLVRGGESVWLVAPPPPQILSEICSRRGRVLVKETGAQRSLHVLSIKHWSPTPRSEHSVVGYTARPPP